MCDGVKVTKDVRHRSCCSVAAPTAAAAAARSERQLQARASVAEVTGMFCAADARCDQLQQNINMIKYLKKKNKSKRRSTRAEVEEQEAADSTPVISVQTKPKRKYTARAAVRSAAGAGGERVPAPARAAEQDGPAAARAPRVELRRREDGAGAGRVPAASASAACGAPRTRRSCTPPGLAGDAARMAEGVEQSLQAKLLRDASATGDYRKVSDIGEGKASAAGAQPPPPGSSRPREPAGGARHSHAHAVTHAHAHLHARHYEAATAASRRRWAARVAPHRRLPFVISATVAPSHNLAVNLQKVLNSLKIQQPPRGIPPTLAHHLGLNHLPKYLSSGALVGACGAARGGGGGGRGAGRSYARALSLLRAGDGPLPRYLRSLHAIPSTRKDAYGWDINGDATDEAKRKLAEYAQLHRELERVDERLGARLGERRDPALELRRRLLVAQLKARQEKVSDIVKKYENESPMARACVSSTEHSTRRFKLNMV